jgi:uncharacterized membrane protein YbhN (UPF0104 family)
MKKKLLFLLKTLVSLGLLSFLLSQIDLSALLHALGSASLPYLALVLVTYLLSQLVSCLRWLFLARPLGFKLSFKEFLSFYFIGMFFNLFAPSTVGGDIGRVFYLARGGMENKERGATAYALVSVVADRAIGLAVLIWIGAVALAIFPMYSLPPIIRVITYAIALGFLLCWVSVPLIKRFLRYVGHPLMENLRLGLEVYWSRQSVVLQAVVLSLIVHFIQAALQVVLSWALHIDLPWSYAFILYPLVGLFSSLPISLNGIGLREGGYLFLLRQIDVSSEKAIAFGLLWFLIVALDSLIGGLVFVLKKNPRSSSDRLGYRGQVK